MSGPRCGAKTRSGGTCGQRPMRGQTRCKMHGGKTPSHLAAGRRRIAEQEATRAIQKAGFEPVGDPVAVLRSLAGEAMELRAYFKQRVDALEQLRYEANAGEQIRGELLMYERALDRSAKFCESLARLNLGERAVQVDEARVVLLVAVLERVLASPALALDPARQAEARTLLIEELRADE